MVVLAGLRAVKKSARDVIGSMPTAAGQNETRDCPMSMPGGEAPGALARAGEPPHGLTGPGQGLPPRLVGRKIAPRFGAMHRVRRPGQQPPTGTGGSRPRLLHVISVACVFTTTAVLRHGLWRQPGLAAAGTFKGRRRCWSAASPGCHQLQRGGYLPLSQYVRRLRPQFVVRSARLRAGGSVHCAPVRRSVRWPHYRLGLRGFSRFNAGDRRRVLG